MAGADTGGILEWSSIHGWEVLPGTQINTANGVAVSRDGEWVYIGRVERSLHQVGSTR